MKKNGGGFFKVIGALLLLFLIGLVILYFSLNSIIGTAVRTFGGKAMGVPVAVDSVNFQPLSGRLAINGLTIANPPEYKEKQAFKLGKLKIELDPKTVFTDNIVIKSIIISDVYIDYEPNFSGSNLAKLKSNIDAYAATGSDTESPKPAEPGAKKKNVEIRLFVIENGIICVSSGMLNTSIELKIPRFELTGIGSGQSRSNGEMLQEIYRQVLKMIAGAVAGADIKTLPVPDTVKSTVKDAGDTLSEGLNKVTNIFK